MVTDMQQIQFLDCTLRDGGYVNNWQFNMDTALEVVSNLYNAGIRCIELGLMGQGGKLLKSTKFSDFSQIEPLLEDRKTDCNYAVMVTQAEYDVSRLEIPERSERTPDLIRLDYFQPESDRAMKTAKLLKKKGYIVFLQAMATFLYSQEELDKHIQAVNEVSPHSFYMVDSFSTMFREDVIRMEKLVLKRLDRDIMFGFHAHNNIQMAYSNAVTFMTHGDGRMLFVDGSIYGMGRGAGNCAMELLLGFLKNPKYNIYPVFQFIQDYISALKEKGVVWGYDMQYLMTGLMNQHPRTAIQFTKEGRKDFAEFYKEITAQE